MITFLKLNKLVKSFNGQIIYHEDYYRIKVNKVYSDKLRTFWDGYRFLKTI